MKHHDFSSSLLTNAHTPTTNLPTNFPSSFLQKVEREAKDMIEILRQFLAMLRFIAELPETLKQLEARERETLERELKRLLQLVEEFKDAIKSLGSSGKKKGTVMSRVWRSMAKTAK